MDSKKSKWFRKNPHGFPKIHMDLIKNHMDSKKSTWIPKNRHGFEKNHIDSKKKLHGFQKIHMDSSRNSHEFQKIHLEVKNRRKFQQMYMNLQQIIEIILLIYSWIHKKFTWIQKYPYEKIM